MGMGAERSGNTRNNDGMDNAIPSKFNATAGKRQVEEESRQRWRSADVRRSACCPTSRKRNANQSKG